MLRFPVRVMAGLAAPMLRFPWLGPLTPPWGSRMAAAYELIARTGLTHHRPAYGIDGVRVGDRDVAVREEPADQTPFGTLLHFKKDLDVAQPRVLLVAPLSGHFATLLRGTVRTLLPEHDVYLTDWHNARDVALQHGAFGFDDYIDHVIRFLEAIGPGLARRRGVPAVRAGAGRGRRDGRGRTPALPRSMTLMAGPIDTRVNPTTVNELATSHPLDGSSATSSPTSPCATRGTPAGLPGVPAARLVPVA